MAQTSTADEARTEPSSSLAIIQLIATTPTGWLPSPRYSGRR
jgi:hypothetical protein